MILPVATLVLVTVPYLYRMMRAAMIESLESDYVEMARLKGLSQTRGSSWCTHCRTRSLPRSR